MRVLVVTGILAKSIVEKQVKVSQIKAEILSFPQQVAALMTPNYISKMLNSAKISSFDLILVPGMMRGNARTIEKSVKVPTFKGPKHAADLSTVLEKIDTIPLSKVRPACELIQDIIRKKALKEVKRVQKTVSIAVNKKANVPIEKLWANKRRLPLILAEIVDASSLDYETLRDKARYYVDEGADIIDLGMEAGGGHKENVEKAVEVVKKTVAKPISIDSNDPDEIEAGVRSGVNLILSINAENMKAVSKFASKVPVVVTPATEDGKYPIDPEERVGQLERNIREAKAVGFRTIIGDLILSPPLTP
ncbi:MAG: dihydropteroate synthase, partial [Candidatus Bathyarchaeota archaeon]